MASYLLTTKVRIPPQMDHVVHRARLFANFLRGELNRRHPDDVAGLHRRAARWYLAHELPEPAFRHAVDGDDVELVIQIFERHAFRELSNGEFRGVQRWLDSLPPEWRLKHPIFGLARAGFLALTGAFEDCVHCVDDIEEMLVRAQGADTRWPMARVTAFRCLMACMQNDLSQAETYAHQALENLPPEDLSFHADIHQALGDTYRQNGQWGRARDQYLNVLEFVDSPPFRVQSAHVYGALADLDLRQGHLRDAGAYWRKALAAIQNRETWGRIPLPVIGWVFIRVGEILYERNEMAEAWDYLSRGLERAEFGGDVRATIAGYLTAGRVKLTQGDVKMAVEFLEKARPLVEQTPFPDWTSRFERFQLELWLAQDRLRATVHWSDEMLLGDVLRGRPESEVAQLAMVHVLILKGDMPSIERALALLERLLQTAEAEGRMDVTIEALALQAMTHWRRGERTGAMTALERALRMAEREGYVRLFADLGLPMARLLQEARSRDVMPDYVAKLLAACRTDLIFPALAERALPEPLTQREQEILKLIAAGLTNHEIADTLVISPQTVKKHTSNIYGKLGVRSRTEAAARARELDLLD